MPLRFFAFSHTKRIALIDTGARPMLPGERGLPVALVQAALVDLGFALPKSTKVTGMDGVFGGETETAVRDFQGKKGLVVDGKIGRLTLRALDDAAFAKQSALPAPPAPPPPKPPPPMVGKHFQVGAVDPPRTPDYGAGPWNSRPTTVVMWTLRLEFFRSITECMLLVGVDATRNLLHYFDNSGKDFSIDLDKMIDEVPSAKALFTQVAEAAKAFVETLPPGTYDLVSTHNWGGYDEKSENGNWFFAVGGYTVWGRGKAVVAAGTPPTFDLTLDYKFYDRYNWDGKKSTELFGVTVTDKFMGEFHRQGLAREYDYYGLARRRFRWKMGERLSPADLATKLAVPSSGRSP